MRIGLFTDTYLPEINGVASSVHILRTQLEKNGHVVYVITTKSESSTQEAADPFVLRLSGIELKKLYGYVLTSPIHISAYNEIKAMNLDIIHAHTEFSVGIFSRIVAKLQGLPLVSTYHTTYEDYTHYVNLINSNTVDKLAKKAVASLSRMYVSSCTEIIAPSQKTKEMLQGYGVTKNIHIIPTGLELDRFNAAVTSESQIKEIHQEVNLQAGETLIVFVGRIAKEKSIDVVIEGFTFIKKAGLKCKFLIVGSGPHESALHDMVKKCGLEEMVVFVGKKPGTLVPAYYHASDAFVSASTSETQGMTYIEALASGLPLFACPDDVLTNLVIENETGYYFKTPEEFCEKVKKYIALSDDEKLKIKKQAVSCAQPYDAAEFYRQIYRVYESAICTYSQMYVIDQIKPKNESIQLNLTAPNSEAVKVLVSLDHYFNNGYRKGSKLSQDEVDGLLRDEQVVKIYQTCLRKLVIKDRTRKEMYDWLTQKTDLKIEDVNKTIERLENQGYIDDLKYTKSAVYTMKLTLVGENKIIRNLKRKGIPVEMVQEVLAYNNDSDTEEKNALRWAEKIKPTIKEKSVKMKKKIMVRKLMDQGYSSEIVSSVMQVLNFVEEEKLELDNLRKIAQKAKKRYEKKYQGFKLRNTVYRYCGSMGFDTEDIYVILDEMEWENE